MQYIIRSFDINSGQITVEYEGQWTYAIDLPIVNGMFPVGEELESLIQQYAPVWLLERKNALEAGVSNSAEIEALVVPKPVPEVSSIEETVEQVQTTIVTE
jgi:hypothetical protein